MRSSFSPHPILPPQGGKGRANKLLGYTLIEILIVIAIISIVASVATLSIHFNRNKQMETFAHDLVNLITLAEEEAILHPATLGLAFTPGHFQLFAYQENTHAWQPLANKVFREKVIPEHTQVTLRIHNKIIVPDGKPKLIISSSGDIPDFVISIGNENEKPSYRVIGEASGNVYAK